MEGYRGGAYEGLSGRIRISVIIPTYKPDCTLYECLDSLRKQTLSLGEFDIVLILNGDKMPYDNEIKEYINESPLNINYAYTGEKGVSAARNIGMSLAKGAYIAFIDSDDWVSENYLSGLLAGTNEKQMALADVRCFDVTHRTYFKDYLGKRYERLQSGILYPHSRIRSYFSTPVGKLIRSEIARKNTFDKSFDFGEDGLFMFSVEPHLPPGAKAPSDAVYYRRCVSGSLSRKKRSRRKIVSNQLKLLLEYWKIYLRNIASYNVVFFFYRNLAVLRHIIKK